MDTDASERELHFADGGSETLLLTPMGDGHFRAEYSSILEEIRYGDIIRAKETENGALRFIDIAEPSPLVTNCYGITEAAMQSEAVQAILAKVMEEGGNWERLFGGLLFLHTSAATAADIDEQIGGAGAKPTPL